MDAGLTLFQFNGDKSSAWEKRKANAIVDEIQASRHGKVKRTLIIDGLGDKGNKMIDEFWAYFGGKPNSLPDEAPQAKKPQVVISLHHISDATGVMETKQIATGKLDKKMLKSDDAMILDAGGAVFVWIGKGANKAEKREAMAYAVKYLGDQGRGADVPIARVMEGKEPKEFWSAFAGKPVMGRKHQGKQWKKKK